MPGEGVMTLCPLLPTLISQDAVPPEVLEQPWWGRGIQLCSPLCTGSFGLAPLPQARSAILLSISLGVVLNYYLQHPDFFTPTVTHMDTCPDLS